MKLTANNNSSFKKVMFLLAVFFLTMFSTINIFAQTLLAGTGKSNITAKVENIHDSLYVKVLVLKNGKTNLAIITLDVVALNTIGTLPNDYYDNVKRRLKNEFGIEHILVNASHNHWDGFLEGKNYVVNDVESRTIGAVKKALNNLEAVKVGAGSGSETRISMNRRVKLKDGTVYTIRHANPNMPDDEVIGIGKFDPEIGILKLDRMDGTSKAVVYNFACHPYAGTLDRGVTAEFPGFASSVIESVLGNKSMAFFLQGFAGDITEILYKNVDDARDCEPFGRMLGLSTLKGLREIETETTNIVSVISKTIELPLRTDIEKIFAILDKQEKELLASLRSSSLNMKSFIPLYVKYKLSPEYPSYYSYRYLQEKSIGINGLKKHDEENRRNMDKYLKNMRAMDKLAQIQENKMFLKRSENIVNATNRSTIKIEIEAIRIGDFVVATFPGEPFAQIALNIKKDSPFKNTFLTGYTNGHIRYVPTADAYKELGYEVMSTILAPEWQHIYEKEVSKILKQLK